MLHKDFGLEIKDVSESGVIEGYASMFGGTPDSYGDIVLPGAFAKTLAKHASERTMPLMLWGHQASELPVGDWVDMAEDGNTIFPAGIYAEHGRNLLIERTTIRDWTTIANGKYRQGDCIDAEWGFVGLTLRDVVLSGCTDGGYDSKARNDLLDRVTAIGNKKSFRLWYSMHTATSIESINPAEVHIETSTRTDGKYGMGAGSLTAKRVTFRSTGKQALFSLGPNAVINIAECVIDVPAGTPFVRYHDGGRASNVKLTLGKTCAMDAKGYAVNTPVTVAAPRGFDVGEILKDRKGNGTVTLATPAIIARINARIKAAGSPLVLKKNDTLKQVDGTWYEIAK